MLGQALARLKLIGWYQSIDFYFLDLSSLPPERPRRPAVSLREVKSSEWEELPFAEGLHAAEEMKNQFARGSRLFAVFKGETVVAMNWFNDQFADLASINRPRVTFPKGTVYSYRAIVSPGHRRQGIGSFMKDSFSRVLRSEGYKIIFLAVFLKDVTPHLWHLANGLKRWGRVTYIDWRIGRFWWTRLTQEGRRHPDLFYA